MDLCKHVLIISNNAISLTSNNGKTIWSLFEDYPKNNLNQLFTRDELPSIKINSYFRITTNEVIRRCINRKACGNCVSTVSNIEQEKAYKELKPSIKRNSLTCLIREAFWLGGWKSNNLDTWLNNIKPDIIFFVAGDTLYSYAICNYIVDKTKADLSVYITDDYVCKRSNESILDSIRRKLIYMQQKKILTRAKKFYTISEKMRTEYFQLFGKDSFPVFNISEKLLRKCNNNKNTNCITFVYMGSLYYGRADVLIRIAKILAELNKTINTKAKLEVYCNHDPEERIIRQLSIKETSEYGGFLSKDKMIEKLNESDVLVFVESFEREQIEKTRLSLSTKISEYLSVGKTILAVGPSEIGSMEFLENSAVCVNNFEKLAESIQWIIKDNKVRDKYGQKALKKYEELGDFRSIRNKFIDSLYMSTK